MKLFHIGKSFYHAFRGVRRTLVTERNFWLHCIAATLVFALAAWFKVSAVEWGLLILVVALVLILEMVNTAIEYLLDLLKPRLHHHVLLIKDAMAGAVLVAAVAALGIGVAVFLPHFRNILK